MQNIQNFYSDFIHYSFLTIVSLVASITSLYGLLSLKSTKQQAQHACQYYKDGIFVLLRHIELTYDPKIDLVFFSFLYRVIKIWVLLNKYNLKQFAIKSS